MVGEAALAQFSPHAKVRQAASSALQLSLPSLVFLLFLPPFPAFLDEVGAECKVSPNHSKYVQ